MANEQSNDIVVSFDGVKMKNFRAYWQAVARGDWAGQDEFFALVVKRWLYEPDPSIAESYADLSLEQYSSVKKAIRMFSEQEVSKIKKL